MTIFDLFVETMIRYEVGVWGLFFDMVFEEELKIFPRPAGIDYIWTYL